MTRLRQDVRGNTLAMMAIALIPISALIGSGVDTARLYVVKARLQQACDAGVLAGRKAMISAGTDSFDTTARDQATTFFRNNFRNGWLNSTAASFTPSATADNQVTAVARVTVPMTIMKMFGQGDTTLSATCQARYDVADSDVMFVLDTTGSMACVGSASSCGQSTVSYKRPDGTNGYRVTEASGSKIQGLRDAVLNFYDTVKATANPTTHVRYGFVTYSSTVNAGAAILGLNPSYMVSKWKYQSRKKVNSKWNYAQYEFDVTDFLTAKPVADPSKDDGSKAQWQGCIEERHTTASSSFDLNNLPEDLDPNLIPTSDDKTKWAPMWPEVIYQRNGTSAMSTASNGFVACGKPVSRLALMTRQQVSDYVNAADFVPFGGTYHDTGMIWGVRMISPNGIFGADTAPWPSRPAPNRYIVFMTDGLMDTSLTTYGLYGMEQLDLRVTGSSSNTSKDTTYHNTRFLTECAAAKAMNIKVFVIGFGQKLTAGDPLSTCASPGQAYYAKDNDELNKAFQKIAQQVALLRISQ